MAQQTGIDVTQPLPRVNYETMGQYVGKRVKLVGKVEGIQGNVLRLKAADDGMVEVRMTGSAPADAYVEVDGTVERAGILVEDAMCGFGNTFGKANNRRPCFRCPATRGFCSTPRRKPLLIKMLHF
jgi:hypothetical protein